eukprot:1152917-Pelagomonas_calceolata.AAC.1
MQVPRQPDKFAHRMVKRQSECRLSAMSAWSTPSTSLHTPRNLCLKSSVKSCKETDVPCFIAVTKRITASQSLKATRDLNVQHEGALKCKCKSAFRIVLSVSQLE